MTLDASTLTVMQAHYERMAERAEFCGVALRRYVFSYASDGPVPWRPDVTSHRWRRARNRVGLDGVQLHDLRHIMATTRLTAGMPVSVVAGRLGHTRPATTLNVYSHFVETGDKVTADVLQKIMDDVSTSNRHDALIAEPGIRRKEVEKALQWAEEHGWTVVPTASGHSWGEMTCGHAGGGGCRVAIWSTPKNPGNHANRLRQRVRNCPH